MVARRGNEEYDDPKILLNNVCIIRVNRFRDLGP